MKKFLTLDDVDVAGKRVLVRLDVNVPMKDGKITDDTRIIRSLPTVQDLVAKKARVILMSHLGRPDGKASAEFSLKPVAVALEKLLGQKVAFAKDCIGSDAETAVADLKDGDVVMLENVRFHAEEEKNDAAFAKNLAKLGDIYINDAFATAHRAHASTEGLAKLLPAAAGRTMQAELEALESALGNPQRPVVAIVGGSKVSSKLDVLNNLVSKVDVLVIGGGMANTFLYADGVNVGKSLCEKDLNTTAQKIMQTAKDKNCAVVVPVDATVAKEFKENAASSVVAVNKVADDEMILDVGPATIEVITEKLKTAKTVVWNGPVGAFETKPFDKGTMRIAKTIAELTAAGDLISVAGGGDTVSALAVAGVTEAMTYVSTAGGAFLEWMEGKELPGVVALEAAARKQAA